MGFDLSNLKTWKGYKTPFCRSSHMYICIAVTILYNCMHLLKLLYMCNSCVEYKHNTHSIVLMHKINLVVITGVCIVRMFSLFK